MHRTFRRVLPALAAVAVALSTGASARAQQVPTLTINQIDASKYPQLRAVATVLDGNGVPVPGLKADQFQAFDGERRLTISNVTSAQDATVPLSVVVTIDVSGSMAGDPLSQAKLAATSFVRQLGASDRATVVVFNDKVATAVPFTNDQAVLTNGFATLQAAGGTALYEAVQASAFAARTTDSPRRAVVLLTDGQNDTQQSAVTGEQALAAARAAGVPMFTVGFGDQPDTAYLKSLADATGGAYLPATTATVGAVYSSIAAVLRDQYVIDLQAQAPADGATAQLRLQVSVASAQLAANASYQRGAAPATATPQPSPTAVPPPAGSRASGGGTSTALVALGAVGAVAAAGGGGVLVVTWWRRRRVVRRQTAVTAANPVQAAAQPLPRQVGAIVDGETALETGTGRLVERRAEGNAVHQLGGGPVVIGSSRRSCTIILPESAHVAPEHARIWLRGGRYLLHHAGGFRRRTLVNGREADWVRLERGDELQVGPHVFVFEDDEDEATPS